MPGTARASGRRAMKVLVTGAVGILGRAVSQEARRRSWHVIETGRQTLDVTDPEACREVLAEAGPDLVVHCAAYTSVDRAEAQPARALAVNRDGTRNVLEAARAVGATLVYPSSDYVFDGRAQRPYRPDDEPNPLSAYGRSKLAGEEEVRSAGDGHLIVRTSWLYGGGGKNFVDTIRRLAWDRREIRVVADQRGRPTWSRSLARTMMDLVESGATGTVHASDAGSATWFDLARAVTEIARAPVSPTPVSSAEYGAPAPRPAYSVLDVSATESSLSRPLPHWRSCLETYLGGVI